MKRSDGPSTESLCHAASDRFRESKLNYIRSKNRLESRRHGGGKGGRATGSISLSREIIYYYCRTASIFHGSKVETTIIIIATDSLPAAQPCVVPHHKLPPHVCDKPLQFLFSRFCWLVDYVVYACFHLSLSLIHPLLSDRHHPEFNPMYLIQQSPHNWKLLLRTI